MSAILVFAKPIKPHLSSLRAKLENKTIGEGLPPGLKSELIEALQKAKRYSEDEIVWLEEYPSCSSLDKSDREFYLANHFSCFRYDENGTWDEIKDLPNLWDNQ